MMTCLKIMTLVILISFVCSSCGVIFGGSRFVGSVIAKGHPNADIYVNGNKTGKGASVGMYHRNRLLMVELKQEGCEPKQQTFDYAFRGGNFVASLLFWGLTGVVIDLATGASFKPDHRHDPAIQRTSDKTFVFMVDYSGCEVKE